MERSRYTSYSERKITGRKRKIALPGSFEDSGKWIRCWNCGFIVNLDRDVGDSEHAAISYSDMVYNADSPVGSGDDPIIGLDSLCSVGTIIENGADGNPITDYYTPRIATVAKGCPCCGCANL